MPPFQTRPVEPRRVEAIQLSVPCRLGKQKGRAGDYLVTHADNRQELVAGAVFARTYEPADGNGALAASPAPAPAHTATLGKRARKPENVKAETAAQKLWEQGVSVKEIARTVKKSTTMIYQWSSTGGWKRPKTDKPPVGEQLKGSVRCNWCLTMTDFDPCRACGKKLKRSW